MLEHDHLANFEQVVLPHLGAAYNLARWLLRNDHDAEDVMQEAMIRAFRFFDGFSGENPRAWLRKVVRNSAFSTKRSSDCRSSSARYSCCARWRGSLTRRSRRQRVFPSGR